MLHRFLPWIHGILKIKINHLIYNHLHILKTIEYGNVYSNNAHFINDESGIRTIQKCEGEMVIYFCYNMMTIFLVIINIIGTKSKIIVGICHSEY